MSRELNKFITPEELTILRKLVEAHSHIEALESELVIAKGNYKRCCKDLSNALCIEDNGEVFNSQIPETLVLNSFDYCWLVRVDWEGYDDHTVEMLGGIATL